jgi:hypothetical protein
MIRRFMLRRIPVKFAIACPLFSIRENRAPERQWSRLSATLSISGMAVVLLLENVVKTENDMPDGSGVTSVPDATPRGNRFQIRKSVINS